MISFICPVCNTKYQMGDKVWKCTCGSFLETIDHPQFSLEGVQRNICGLWRYKEILPKLNEHDIVTFGEGMTPLEEIRISGHRVFIKHDYLFPSGSYKDRGNTVLVSWLKAIGISSVIEDSSGNAGASLAMYAAKAGIKVKILVPENTAESKMIQAMVCGAEVIKVKGDRKAASEEALFMAKNHFYASHVYSPLFYHGTKTLAYELYEQLGENLCDRVIFPVGNGSLLIGLFFGFSDLKKAGLIRELPQLVAVQHESFAPLYNALFSDKKLSNEPSSTVAEGIAISSPVRLLQMVKIACTSNVIVETVNENEVLSALRMMIGKGYFIEPTSAVAVAGFLKAEKTNYTRTVVVLTGNGLKTADKLRNIQYNS